MKTNRREFIKLSALTAGSIIGGNLLSGCTKNDMESIAKKGHVLDSKAKSMTFSLTYTTEIINLPKMKGKMNLWIPVPQGDYEQDITKLSISSPVEYSINTDPYYRNKMIYIDSNILKKDDKITFTCIVKRKTVSTIKDENEDIKKHLLLTKREKWDKNITTFVDELIGQEKNPLEIGKKIFYSLVDYLTYDKKIQGCGMGISAWTFENKRGKCDDWHALFRTMMIYKEIPVKWQQGFPLPYPSAKNKTGTFEGDCTGAHCWLRFYIGDGKWMPVDVSEASKRKDLRDYFFGTLSPNRFLVSTGRDVILKPIQSGEPLSSFYFTYGENNDIPLIYSHHYRNLIHFKVLDVEV